MPVVGPEKLVKLQQQGDGIRNVGTEWPEEWSMLMFGQLILSRSVYWRTSYVHRARSPRQHTDVYRTMAKPP